MTEDHPQNDVVDRAPLTVRHVFATAFSVYREDFARVAGAAAAVFGAAAVLGTAADLIARHFEHDLGGVVWVLLFSSSLAMGSSVLLADVFYAGLLDKLVGASRYGHQHLSVREVLRTLPYKRLLVADVIVVAVSSLGWALFAVPGLVVLTLLAIVGPVINIEGHGVRASLRRSVQLVWPRFWLVFVTATLVIIIETIVLHAVDATLWPRPLLVAFVSNAVLGALVGALACLCEVVLAHELIARDRERAATVARRRPPRQGES